MDPGGATSNSNSVRISIGEEAVPRVLLTSKEGDTVESLARSAGVSTQTLLDLNPALDPNASPDVGQQVAYPLYVPAGLQAGTAPVSYIPTPLQPVPYPLEFQSAAPGGNVGEGDSELPGSGPSGAALWLERLFNTNQKAPSPPILAGGPEGCGARLLITDKAGNESGFFVYRLAPGEKV